MYMYSETPNKGQGVVRDVDKAENGCAVAFMHIMVQSYAEELGVGILERG